MLTTSAIATKLPLTMDPSSAHSGLSGVFAAAVVSNSFREMLLSQPEKALSQGYMGKQFAITAEDAALIISINARSLPELAQQVVQTLSR